MISRLQPHIGLVPIYVDYYEELDSGLAARKSMFIRALTAAFEPGARVTAAGLVRSEAEAAEATRRLAEIPVDVVVVIPTVAAFSDLSLGACTNGDLPLFILHASEEDAVPAGYSMAAMVSGSGGLGLQALSNALVRVGRRFTLAAGNLHDPSFVPGVLERLRALAVPGRLGRSCLGLIGSTFEGMSDVALDLGALETQLSIRSITVSKEDWKEAYRTVESTRVEDLLQDLEQRFTIQAISRPELKRSSRLALALDTLVETHGMDFCAINSHGSNCLQDDEIGVMATLGASLLTSRGIPVAEVGDAPTAIAMAIGRLLAGACVYAELDAVDLRREAWFIANSGELDFDAASCSSPVVLRGSENFRGRRGRGASFDAVIREGPATLLSFTPTPAGPRPYRLIAAQGEILPERFDQFHSVHALMRVRSAREDFESWCRAGAVHHAALVPADIIEALETLCAVWDPVELCRINS